ncbi:transcription regulator gal80 [Neonectria punicea]|uniref:Transcription regulator gal80 n=1 Tax=Neonectria punicea TaxID=979145 RepID=A0ABR1GYR2_9HYPO
MAPIRVALVGLAPLDNGEPTVGNWGALAHLKGLLESPHYELVAICNSSIESARKSIEFHKLPPTVKAYGNAEDLANDPDVDLISISVNVGKHYQLAKPALLNKKHVMVEWPLGASLDEAQELTDLARQQGVKTVVGLQFRADPLLLKVRELLGKNAVGRVTSSVVLGCSNVIPYDIWLDEASYYLDINSGGNEFYIFFGHFLDAFTSVLGGFKTIQSVLKTQHPVVPTVSMATGQTVDPAHPRTAPDHTFVQGELESGVVVTLSFRKAKKPTDGLGLRWLITGTEGEIEVTIPEDHLQMGHAGRAIRLRTGKEEVSQTIRFDEEEPAHVAAVPIPGTNTARVYEAFATSTNAYADFESSLDTHKLLDDILQASKKT